MRKAKTSAKPAKWKPEWKKTTTDLACKRANRDALWQSYKNLQKEADTAFEKFKNHVNDKANAEIILQDHYQLLLLLGECDYMAREVMRMQPKKG